MIVVSGVDWDNRFIMPLLPFIILLAIAGLKFITDKKLLSKGTGIHHSNFKRKAIGK
jgi:hypothetical protein